eukprot:m.171063 g.171063  ORF g.171063 m.171063 type:complete len:884 (-) comp13331_c0_seq1:2752-5403(-)
MLRRYMVVLWAMAEATQGAVITAPPPAPTPAPLTCQSPEIKDLPFCDITLPFEDRVADLLPRLNLTEKIGQTGMVASEVARLGMESYNFGGEALHGVWATCVTDNITTPTHTATGRTLCPTQFPAPIHMSNAWNRDLWRAAADVASTEARALYGHNRAAMQQADGSACSRSLEGCLGLSYYTPNINLARDPSWGRIEETPGEDPYVNGEYAYAFTTGFQNGYAEATTSKYMKASVTVKHYASYNVEIDIENTDPDVWCGATQNEGGPCHLPNSRHSLNAHVSPRDLHETYLAPFQRAVDADAGAIMCSYNAVNGEPMCTNRDLIGNTLRTDFGFNGVVATDCGALNDALGNHMRYKTAAETAAAAIKAGTDSNCGNVFTKALPAALGANATLTEAELDVSVARLLYARFRLGLFDADHPDATVPKVSIADVDTQAHEAVALQAAREGIVLLQNGGGKHFDARTTTTRLYGAGSSTIHDNDVANTSTMSNDDATTPPTVSPSSSNPPPLVLPITKARYPCVAMMGPMANASMNLLSGYHGSPPFLVSPLAAMQAAWGGSDNVIYHVGCNVSDTGPTAGGMSASIAAAVTAAKEADVIVLGLGLCGDNYGGGPPKEDATCFKIDEAEGTDRWNLTLPSNATVTKGSQMTLFRALYALGKPLAVFVMNAGPVDISEIKATGVPIVAAGYGGEYGGQATVDVLTGAYNPGGALTVTTYPEHYRHAVSFRDMSMRPSSGNGHLGRTYKFLDTDKVTPVWEFGWGLSYTTFSLTFVQTPTAPIHAMEDTTWLVSIENTGSVPGGMAVICYVTAVNQSVVPDAPQRSVFDFNRVNVLQVGEHQLLSMTLTASARGLWTEDGVKVYPTGTYAVECRAGGVATTKPVTLHVM